MADRLDEAYQLISRHHHAACGSTSSHHDYLSQSLYHDTLVYLRGGRDGTKEVPVPLPSNGDAA